MGRDRKSALKDEVGEIVTSVTSLPDAQFAETKQWIYEQALALRKKIDAATEEKNYKTSELLVRMLRESSQELVRFSAEEN